MTFRDTEAYNNSRRIPEIEQDISLNAAGIATVSNTVNNILTLGGLFSYSSTTFYAQSVHMGAMIRSTGSSANTFYVQQNITYSPGRNFHIMQYGTGRTNIRGFTNVTLRSAVGDSINNPGTATIYLRTRYSSATIIMITQNEWVVVGDISSS
jgi:hypothetical protein